MTPLSVIREHGLEIRAEGDRLHISPRDRLTDELRTWIREHKPDLIAVLRVTEACHGLAITPEQFYALTTEDDREDIRTGKSPIEHLRWYAQSLADGIQCGRIIFHPTTRHLMRHN